MAVLGKRKASEPSMSQEEANEIFRRHFEAQFAPIEEPPTKKAAVESSDNEDDGEDNVQDAEASSDEEEGDTQESEWGGLSDDEISDDDDEHLANDQEPAIEVVDHSSSQPSKPPSMSKRDLKAFMSSRPPDQTAQSNPAAKPSQPSSSTASSTLPEDAPSLLAQDLELRRLLSESHLLASPSLTTSSSGAEPKLFAAGRVRQKATDLRAQALGSKTSIFAQENMPMLVRKTITANADKKEAKRRKEARENGIILERPAAANGKKPKQRRDRGGVDRPGVGRLRGAELRISDKDVKSIEGTRDTFGRKGGGGRGRKR